MHTWHKRDWKQFYELARRPWQRHRPPRPVYPSGLNRVAPAAGFSLSELDDAHAELGSSMQRDIAAGRPPELDAIPGAVLRAGKRHGIECPTVARLMALIANHAGIRPAPD